MRVAGPLFLGVTVLPALIACRATPSDTSNERAPTSASALSGTSAQSAAAASVAAAVAAAAVAAMDGGQALPSDPAYRTQLEAELAKAKAVQAHARAPKKQLCNCTHGDPLCSCE